jgi:hypothetical protein
MATVIRVTGTGFDNNVWGLIPDNDGTTCWAFLDTAVGNTTQFARFSLVDGSIVHAGNLFAGLHSLTNRTDASVYWTQNNGHYYALSRPSVGHLTLYKFHIAPSGGGGTEVLDTYSTTTASVDLHTALGNTNFATNLIAWTVGGTDYVAVQSTSAAAVAVFDASTMALVGTYSLGPGFQPAAALGGQAIFADKFGDLWMSGYHTDLFLSRWHPADGVTGSVLNAVDTDIPNTTTGFTVGGDETFWLHYVASNHSVMLGSFGTPFPRYTTDLSNVLLGTPGNPGTFTQNTFRADDGSFFLNMVDTNLPYDCTDLELTVTQPSGKLAIQSDTTGPEFNTQIGGLFNLIDPIALTSYGGIYPFDITQAILGAAVPAPPQESYSDHGTNGLHYNPLAEMVYSETSGSVAVTYTHQDFSTGSALYLIVFSAPAINTTTAVVASPNPTALFVTTQLSATVTPASGPAPGVGTVQFKENGVNIGSPVNVVAGVAQLNHSFTTAGDVGTQTITGVYSGGTGFNGSTSPGYSLVITKGASTTLLLTSEGPSFFEDEVTFNMTVTGGGPTPTGNIILTDAQDPAGNFGGPYTLPLTSGAASIIINTMNPGLHTLTAAYQGNTLYDVSTHNLIQQVLDLTEPLAVIPGFALIASFSSQGDSGLLPQAQLSVIPVSAPANTSLTLLWTVLNVPKIQITTLAGFDTGLITTTGSGAYVVSNGVLSTTIFTLHALDATGSPILVGGNPLVTTATATVV